MIVRSAPLMGFSRENANTKVTTNSVQTTTDNVDALILRGRKPLIANTRRCFSRYFIYLPSPVTLPSGAAQYLTSKVHAATAISCSTTVIYGIYSGFQMNVRKNKFN